MCIGQQLQQRLLRVPQFWLRWSGCWGIPILRLSCVLLLLLLLLLLLRLLLLVLQGAADLRSCCIKQQQQHFAKPRSPHVLLLLLLLLILHLPKQHIQKLQQLQPLCMHATPLL